MKFMALMLVSSSLIFSSCGKKAEIEDGQDKTIEPSVAEIYFNALKEVERSVNENDLPALQKILQHNPGIDLNQILHNGDTFLTLSIKKDFRDIRNYLIEKGVSLERVNVNKRTPLLVAVASGMENTVKVLLDRKVDLEKRDANGDTALHLAIKNSDDKIALLLIKQGAKVEALDKRERNAWNLSQEFSVPESQELIKSILQIETGAPDIASFRSILVAGDTNRLNGVLSRYPTIAVDRAYESINPLALLVEVKDETSAMRSAELLLNYKANVDGPGDAELTPLIKATLLKKKSFANLFLTSHANPHLYDIDGKSALIHATEMNNLEMVKLLLDFSALEKYSFRKDGKKITFSACDTARATGKRLTTKEDKDINKEIKDRLDCGFLNWLF